MDLMAIAPYSKIVYLIRHFIAKFVYLNRQNSGTASSISGQHITDYRQFFQAIPALCDQLGSKNDRDQRPPWFWENHPYPAIHEI